MRPSKPDVGTRPVESRGAELSFQPVSGLFRLSRKGASPLGDAQFDLAHSALYWSISPRGLDRGLVTDRSRGSPLRIPRGERIVDVVAATLFLKLLVMAESNG